MLHAAKGRFHINPFNRKGAMTGPFPVEWRRGRDSNPRWAFDPYSLSRGAPSASRPPLREPCIHPTPVRITSYLPVLRPAGQRRCAPPFNTAPGDFAEPPMGHVPLMAPHFSTGPEHAGWHSLAAVMASVSAAGVYRHCNGRNTRPVAGCHPGRGVAARTFQDRNTGKAGRFHVLPAGRQLIPARLKSGGTRRLQP
jgi:hypothetical protein